MNTVRAEAAEAERSLSTLLDALEQKGAVYCLVRAYDDALPVDGSDVDLVTSAGLPGQFGAALAAAGERSGWRLVQVIVHESGCSYVLARTDHNRRAQFLRVDAWSSPDVDGHRFYSGEDLMRHRRRVGSMWIPSPAIQFGCRLVKRIVKRDLMGLHAAHLSGLFAVDPAGCAREIARFWGTESAGALAVAATTGSWETVHAELSRYRIELLQRELASYRVGTARHAVERTIDRARRLVRPTNGLHVVFLGPDGVGKSTLIESIEHELASAFSGVVIEAVAPSLSQILDGSFRGRERHGPDERASRPHALESHSFVLSCVKVAYWLAYYTLVYVVTVRPSLARGRLVLHHRHLLDALVDPKRYRYSGPQWLLRLLWRIVPKPDMVLLLDAPSAVIRSRKQELPYDEIERQRSAYRSLASVTSHGHMLDTRAPRADVTSDAIEILVGHLADRAKLRLGL